MILKNPYLEEFLKIPSLENELDSVHPGGIRTNLISRKKLVRKYAWAIPDDGSTHLIRECTDRVIEIGAGTGYWAWMLTQVGVDVVAYDTHLKNNFFTDGDFYHKVFLGGAGQVRIHPDRTLFMCWPPMDTSFAHQALSIYQGDTFIFVGEPGKGTAGDDAFHDLLEQEWEEIKDYQIPVWDCIWDMLIVFERR